MHTIHSAIQIFKSLRNIYCCLFFNICLFCIWHYYFFFKILCNFYFLLFTCVIPFPDVLPIPFLPDLFKVCHIVCALVSHQLVLFCSTTWTCCDTIASHLHGFHGTFAPSFLNRHLSCSKRQEVDVEQ